MCRKCTFYFQKKLIKKLIFPLKVIEYNRDQKGILSVKAVPL